MNILIAGCGRLGTALGLELVDRGHRVWGMRRDTGRLPPAISAVQGDLTSDARLDCLPARFDVLFYTAAADTGDDEGYRRAYVEGPRAVLAALVDQGHPVRRAFFTSSTAVYHQQNGEWVDEESPTKPDSFRGARMLEGEGVFRDAPLPGCSVRFGGIYGPGRTWLLDAVRSGRAAPSPTYTNRIHEVDCVGILVHLMELSDLAPLYLGVDSDPAPRSEVITWLASRAGVEVTAPAAPAGGRAWAGNKRCHMITFYPFPAYCWVVFFQRSLNSPIND